MGERLYNGIEIPDLWPPRDMDLLCPQPQRVPYLEARPEVVEIDLGRQLFVDDLLIEKSGTEMVRAYHRPVKYPGNPVFFPQGEDEHNEELPPCAIAKSGGVWFDPQDDLFKMWYMASYLGTACLATSRDGVHWERPDLDVVPGTNLILDRAIHPDSGSVIIDHETENGDERYKYLLREPDPLGGGQIPARMFTSPDGVHWTERGETGTMGDRSTCFYNPFRRKWVQSIRTMKDDQGRLRYYHEADDFLASGNFGEAHAAAPWLRADCMDESEECYPQLYNVDAIAYESLMLSFHQILKGPPNQVGESRGLPKLTELTVGYSRDGFHFHRPDRRAFIGARREAGSWEYGYVESTPGNCLVVGDELWFYYSAYAGDPARANTESWYVNGTYANGAVGLAKLRRDGFASMRACWPGAILRTRPVRFSGSHLFVNANTAGARLEVEVQDRDCKTIEGFSFEDCIPFLGNSTATEVRWVGGDLSRLVGQPVRFFFRLSRGEIYSFWVSQTESGASGGYVGAGGPGFTGPTDTVGTTLEL
ncbi:MAG: glycoside hydrolase family protein [Planctomycetota bacterium]|jgi:hypothetical protein